MADETQVTPVGEQFSFGKFFSGIFNGINTAKALTTTIHQIFIAVVVGSVIFCGVLLYKHFHPKKVVAPVLPIAVTTNSGTVHSSTDDNRRKLCFLSLCF